MTDLRRKLERAFTPTKNKDTLYWMGYYDGKKELLNLLLPEIEKLLEHSYLVNTIAYSAFRLPEEKILNIQIENSNFLKEWNAFVKGLEG